MSEDASGLRPTIALLTHGYPPDTNAGFMEVADVAHGLGARVVCSRDEAEKHGVERYPDPFEPAEGVIPTVCIVLGGDGSVLQALRTYAGYGVPVFGINYGRLGFLSTVERDSIADAVKNAVGGAFERLELPALEVTSGESRWNAFNDVTFQRPTKGRVAEIAFSLGGEEISNVRCDGLVAASPAGSTGYNLANGGPVLAWGVEGYVISFIAPHTLTARPLVAAARDILHVRNLSPREFLHVAVDGRPVGRLEYGSRAQVAFADRKGVLAQTEGMNFYRRFREKFGLLTAKWTSSPADMREG